MIGSRARRARTDIAVDDRTAAVALQAASLLLAYPDEESRGQLPLVAAASQTLPAPVRDPLLRAVCWLSERPLADLQAAYVDTFDLQRRCCLYLTYYSHGDTRKRGVALLRFTTAYRAAGAQLHGEELPDHLGVVCEFAAGTDLRSGLRLLAEHRAGVELLRMALAEADSPYLDVVDAVRAVLPAATARDLDTALALAHTGPPAEEVGLEPFGPPEQMGGAR